MILCEGFQPPAREEADKPPIEALANADDTVCRAFADALRPPPPIDLTEWACTNIVFGKESPFPGPYDTALFPFFRVILDCLGPDHPSREVILRGSAQVGKTILANIFVGGSLDLDPGPVHYVHPTLENGEDWALTKWKPFVQNSKPLRRIFPAENRSRATTNKALFKERADGLGHLMISGANSPASLSMRSFPRQVQDDLAKWKDNEAGDPETQADSRTQAFPWGKTFKISTPYIKGACRITANFERSDQRYYEVPCPHCGHEHALEWENFKQSLFEGMDFSEAHFTCPSCGSVIEHHHKESMVAAGQWRARNPASKVPGFHLWSAYSPLYSWAWLAEEYFKAKGNPEKEQAFMNDKAGEQYEDAGESPPWEDLKKRAESSEYSRAQIPAGAVLLTAGVDVQGDRIEWQVKGWGAELRRYTIDHGVIDFHISEAEAWKELDALLARKWRNVFGREIGLDMLAIDANYEKNDVHDWAKRHPESRVITVKGANQYTAPPLALVNEERKNSGKIKKRQKRFYLVGVSGLKASFYKHLDKQDPFERGYCAYPKDLDDEYYQQVCSEFRVTEIDRKTGRTVMYWKKRASVRNEMLDTEVYAEAAARRIGWHNKPDGEWERLRAEREAPVPDAQLDLLEPSLPRAVPAAAIAAATTAPDTRSRVDRLA